MCDGVCVCRCVGLSVCVSLIESVNVYLCLVSNYVLNGRITRIRENAYEHNNTLFHL